MRLRVGPLARNRRAARAARAALTKFVSLVLACGGQRVVREVFLDVRIEHIVRRRRETNQTLGVRVRADAVAYVSIILRVVVSRFFLSFVLRVLRVTPAGHEHVHAHVHLSSEHAQGPRDVPLHDVARAENNAHGLFIGFVAFRFRRHRERRRRDARFLFLFL